MVKFFFKTSLQSDISKIYQIYLNKQTGQHTSVYFNVLPEYKSRWEEKSLLKRTTGQLWKTEIKIKSLILLCSNYFALFYVNIFYKSMS